MKVARCFPLLVILLALSLLPAEAKKSPANRQTSVKEKRSGRDAEAATRLQVFLDRANFAPGKIDGHYGDFTLKALALYRQSHGEQLPPAPVNRKPGTAPDMTGLDLRSVEPVFLSYTVTPSDLENVGPLPAAVAEQAKLKSMPYRDAAEAIAEKFHCDRKFFEQLNPGKTKAIKAGDQLKVPNVEPFELQAVKDIKPGSEITPATAVNEFEQESDKSSGDATQNEHAAPSPTAPPVSIKVDTKTNMLAVFEGEKIIAAYPVTIGSAQTASPLGEWKVRGVAKLPTFRYDEQMLQRGKRSKDFYMLPAGPNSPVGVMWIALNKKGIGFHGTAEPDAIGRSSSHGCIRLANWDVVRLAGKVKGGVPVSIH